MVCNRPVATVRLTRAEQVNRNRALVLEAARQVFLERGYAGATLEVIAETAGFSKGVMYSQFASKADLMLALLEARITERAEENARVAATAAGMEGFRALMAASARRSGAGDWPRLLIEFRVVAARDPAVNDRSRRVAPPQPRAVRRGRADRARPRRPHHRLPATRLRRTDLRAGLGTGPRTSGGHIRARRRRPPRPRPALGHVVVEPRGRRHARHRDHHRILGAA